MSVHKVEYKGLSDIRVLSKKDLDKHGVGVAGDLVFDKFKSGALPAVYVQDVSDALLAIFKSEGTFKVTEVDEKTLRESGADPIVDGGALDDTGKIVRDGTTGQVSTPGESNADADPVRVPKK